MSPTVSIANSWLEKALKHVYLVMLQIKCEFKSFLSHVFPFHTPFVMIKCLHSWEGKPIGVKQQQCNLANPELKSEVYSISVAEVKIRINQNE